MKSTSVDSAMIDLLVRTFYAQVRADELLAPVFAARITDWEPHLVRIGDFWSSIMLMTGRYQGNPAQMHLPLPVNHEHFDRWVQLFEETAREVCPPTAAAEFIQRARRIAQSLEFAIAARRGQILDKGERSRPEPEHEQ